jgi:hypothetical protein
MFDLGAAIFIGSPSFVNVPRSIASYVLRGDWVQSTSFLTAHERNRRGNRRGGAHANQGQRDPAAPGFGDAVRHKKSNAERQCRAGADDEAEQWGIQDEVHDSLHA